MPFIFLLYLVNYVDRTALGIAAPNGMSDELQMTATLFGLASGIFFVGYILLEVPSAMAAQRTGARVWIARIAITWGAVASLTAFVPNYQWLIVARFLLGVAEAGFAPTVLLYLTIWFSNRERPKAFSVYLLGIPISSVVAGPVASWLINAGDGVFGLSGWRFMTLMTGVPAIILGVAALFWLTDRPSQAAWLTDAEKEALIADHDEHTPAEARGHAGGMLFSLRSGRVWIMGFAYLGVVYSLYTIGFFLPSVVSGFAERFGTDFTVIENGFIIAVPYVFAAAALMLWPRHATRSGDIGWHVLISTVVGALGIVIAAFAGDPWIVMLGVTLCAVGVISAMPLVYSLPARILSSVAVGAGLALVNTIGNVGGFAGPFVTGWLRDLFGNDQGAFAVVALLLLTSGVISVAVQSRTHSINEALQRNDPASRRHRATIE
ncbi:MFS transporter [Mycolicibacterium smegmatis]|uniref:MFS transporter n=1 Tax=Mycolicibacterium smegmatis TaxID=1772 RepID=UPI001CBE5B18|nr:MFS transporter [Mycolicibacterium smegmatis]MDF1901024.1 MFS transporter [Mycolicibacterium smegmatis]MDF1907200.1 MFS transporter [Mycolicibacterium smegmatis]MDF1917472.1 MFS transporter [Mycolicibacterium smegmatis]MDF1925462.1 MFS transporter [Mycolicibacterium smegmatis]UGT76685.1 MFS transporter [Mycolicibacterium smegmatis]